MHGIIYILPVATNPFYDHFHAGSERQPVAWKERNVPLWTGRHTTPLGLTAHCQEHFFMIPWNPCELCCVHGLPEGCSKRVGMMSGMEKKIHGEKLELKVKLSKSIYIYNFGSLTMSYEVMSLNGDGG